MYVSRKSSHSAAEHYTARRLPRLHSTAMAHYSRCRVATVQCTCSKSPLSTISSSIRSTCQHAVISTRRGTNHANSGAQSSMLGYFGSYFNADATRSFATIRTGSISLCGFSRDSSRLYVVTPDGKVCGPGIFYF